MSVPIEKWWPSYIRALYILSRTYRPGKDFTVEQSSDAMKCFVISVTKLLPDQKDVKSKFMNFVTMTKETSQTLLQTLPRFFSVFPNYAKAIQQDGPYFLSIVSRSNDSMFIWVYLLEAYILASYNLHSKIPSLNDRKKEFEPSILSKYDWGSVLWYIIHMSALYAPQPLADSFEDYRSLLNCLQYLLPCPKCREHLRVNLTKINLDRCAKTAYDLFKCSVDLHNIVNVSKDNPSPEVSYEQALKLYS